MISGLIAVAMEMFVASAGADVMATADGVAKPATGVAVQGAAVRTITYDVSTRGSVVGDVEEFRRVAMETFADARGWGRARVKFVEVQSGGRMHLVLASGAEVGALSGCSETLSCAVYPSVYINDTRWVNGSDSYRDVGLVRYRQMVINHEVGHFLGHHHITACETGTGLAPVMLQQSTGLLGCKANEWPLPGELWYDRW